MSYFNSATSAFFDLLMAPFRSMDPILPLLVFSLVTGIIMLIIFRYTSNQKGIKEIKGKIKAHLLEIRLFKDDLGIILSAQKNILRHNLTYMKYALTPMLFMMIPVLIILIQLEGWFGHEPLNPGESAVVSVNLSEDAGMNILSDLSLRADGGVVIETPPVRIPSEGQVSWRIRATDPGEHNLVFNISGNGFEKNVVVSNGKLNRVSPIVASSFWDTLLYPGEQPIAGDSSVKKIEVDYPSRSIGLFGWGTHWLVIFFIVSIIFGFAFKGLFKVEI